MVEPTQGGTPAAGSFGIGAGLWWVLSYLVALIAGGYVAARLGLFHRAARRPCLQGLVTPGGGAMMFTIYLLSSAVGGIMGSAFNVLGSTLSGSSGAISDAAPQVAPPRRRGRPASRACPQTARHGIRPGGPGAAGSAAGRGRGGFTAAAARGRRRAGGCSARPHHHDYGGAPRHHQAGGGRPPWLDAGRDRPDQGAGDRHGGSGGRGHRLRTVVGVAPLLPRLGTRCCRGRLRRQPGDQAAPRCHHPLPPAPPVSTPAAHTTRS